jgi:hypothetical protein
MNIEIMNAPMARRRNATLGGARRKSMKDRKDRKKGGDRRKTRKDRKKGGDRRKSLKDRKKGGDRRKSRKDRRSRRH